MLPRIEQYLNIICREEMKDGSGVRTYILPDKYEVRQFQAFALRSRYNPELQYFAVKEEALTEEQTPIILKLLEIDGKCSVATKITV